MGKTTQTGSTRPVSEIREQVDFNRERLELNYKKAVDALKQIRDPNRISISNILAYDREKIRVYLQNPANNEVGLREAARYLYYRSQILFRIVCWYASMFDLRIRKVVPNYSLTKTNNPKKIMKQYSDTLNKLDLYDLHNNMYHVLVNVFLEDICYGIFFRDESGSIIYPLDPSWCRIDGIYMTGDYGYSVDMSKFKSGTQRQLVEWLGEPLVSMYKEYEDNGTRWVHMPDEYAACFKFHTEDINHIIPPLAPILQSVAGLNDLSDIQAMADEASIYKLLLIPMKTISGSKMSDDWEISPDLTLQYLDRLKDQLPDFVSAAPVTGEVKQDHVIDFSQTTTDKDIDRLEQAQKQLLGTSGGGAVLNANMVTMTAAFNAWLKAETEFAISPLIPQIQGFTNRMLRYDVSNPCKVEYFEVSVYTKEEARKNMLESCQYSFANRLAYNTFLGISEKETLAMNYLENEILGLPEKMVFPLSSSYTQSGTGEVGRPTTEDDELSQSGERTRNQ